jgi:hypothetical protein
MVLLFSYLINLIKLNIIVVSLHVYLIILLLLIIQYMK